MKHDSEMMSDLDPELLSEIQELAEKMIAKMGGSKEGASVEVAVEKPEMEGALEELSAEKPALEEALAMEDGEEEEDEGEYLRHPLYKKAKDKLL